MGKGLGGCLTWLESQLCSFVVVEHLLWGRPAATMGATSGESDQPDRVDVEKWKTSKLIGGSSQTVLSAVKLRR